MIEPLEPRIAPATIVSTTTLTYQDVDGDNVTVKFTKPILDPLDPATANAIFLFAAGGITGSNAAKQQLQLIELNSPAFDAFAGIGISVTSARNPTLGGDGFVNVGSIRAEIDLAAVTVDGDLAGISGGRPGNADSVIAVKSLTAQSMGQLGTATQMGGDVLSGNIRGTISTLNIKGDLRGVAFFADGIGKATIGGSIIGNATASSGVLNSTVIKTLTVGGDLIGAGSQSGRIDSDSISSIVLKGSIYGGTMVESGMIGFGNSPKGTVKVLGDVRGGGAAFAGAIVGTAAKSISVGGSVVGGDGTESGGIQTGTAGTIVIAHDVTGGGGVKSGRLRGTTAEGIKSITIGGSLVGGSVADSGTILTAGDLGSLTVTGDLRSGAGLRSGSVTSTDAIGSILVKGSLIGTSASRLFIFAEGDATPTLTSDLAIGKLTVLGRVEYARILAGFSDEVTPTNGNAQIGAVTIGRDWIASDLAAGATTGPDLKFGTFDDAGQANAIARIGSILIKGQVLGTFGGPDGFGFVSPVIGSFKVGGTAFPLTATTDDPDANDPLLLVGATNDVRVHEVAV